MDELHSKRISILKDIIDYYTIKGEDSKIRDALINKKNLADILIIDARLYSFFRSSFEPLLPIEEQIKKYQEYNENLTFLRRAFDLYEQYVEYFLGTHVVFPSLNYDSKKDEPGLSLIDIDGNIDYSYYLNELNIDINNVR